jgi:hypothetical protein
MANMRHIARLYAAEPKGPAEPVQRKELQQNFAEVPPAPEQPLLRRFRRWSGGRQEPEQAYTLGGPEILAIMEPGAPVDRTGDFAALAAQQQILQFARRAARRSIGSGFPLIQA